MKLLILGGTRFLGRHIAETASAAGHAVTIFHRGQTPCPLPANVLERFGDRTTPDVATLARERWDLVVDTSGFDPETVGRAARALEPAIGRYIFVSTISVYADASIPDIAEDAPLAALVPTDEVSARYGPLKAAAEGAARDILGARATIVRPGLIIGPYDPTDRFTYWAERLARGGNVLAPGRPERPVQFIDARDLAWWLLRLAEDDATGTFNATGPLVASTMGELLETGIAVLNPPRGTRLHWVDDEALLAAGIAPWNELPLWLPECSDHLGFLQVNIERARAAGLRTRDVASTFRDTAAWAATLPSEREYAVGLIPERERGLLESVGIV
ncbi:NAD-dependent epimerase/dehydratase family protein [bacterium]|nr:MAG: NAD-dependent epimerase/dehydratase family protein [bacterium]